MTLFDLVNPIAWVLGNVFLLLDFALAVVFVLCYFIFWDIRTTTGGEHVWTAFLALALIGLLNFIGLFVDGQVQWYQFPDSILWWRPLLRLAVYGFVGFAFARLVVFLFKRKFWPETVTHAPDAFTAPKPRTRKKRP